MNSGEVGRHSRRRGRQRGACPGWPRSRRKSEWERTQTPILMDMPGKRHNGQLKCIMRLCIEHATVMSRSLSNYPSCT